MVNCGLISSERRPAPMRFWPFGSKRNPPRREHQRPEPDDVLVPTGPQVVPFSADTFELPNAKLHGLRSLLALHADRHSACHLQHPFCGTPPGPGEGALTLVAFATSQQDETSGDPVVALYLCRAEPAPSSLSEKQCSKLISSSTQLIIPITVLLEPISHR